MDSGSPRSIQLEDLTHVDIEAQAPPEPKLSILKRIATSVRVPLSSFSV
jgi:hypothetical protein